MKKVEVIGLTGQSGSGKTTISSYLRSKGFIIIDADEISRKVLSISECKEQLINYFGKEILLPNGAIDRKKLAINAFSSSENTKVLNEITHPIISKRIQSLLQKYKLEYNKIVLDVPLLFETELNKFCDVVISVLADESLRLQRIVNRDNIDVNVADLRLRAQKDDEFYKIKSDFIIYNNSSKEDMFMKVNEILEKILMK